MTISRPRRVLSSVVVLNLALWSNLAPRFTYAADPPSNSGDADVPAKSSGFHIRPKQSAAKTASSTKDDAGGGGLLQPDLNVIDAPTTAVQDYGGYSTLSRFYSMGGVLEYVNFGVFQNLNLGGSLAMDGIIGNSRNVRLRSPNAQVKYRFYDGDRWLPSAAVGFDGQGFGYNSTDRRYNERQRGFYVVATEELGVPGLEVHPSLNISDFDTNRIYGSIPFSFNIKDKVSLLAEWDSINNWSDSRLNMGVRAYITPHFHLDFAMRRIGQGGTYGNGEDRKPERIVQIRYSGNF